MTGIKGGIAAAAAFNFRSFKRDIGARTTFDRLIGTRWIENRRPVLHNDSDFRPMAQHLGLIEAPMTA